MKLPGAILLNLCVLTVLALAPLSSASAQINALLPDQPIKEWNAKDTEKQMDVLLTLVDPFTHRSFDMDMPQMLAVTRIVPMTEEEKAIELKNHGKTATLKSQREELLGELEEIRYLGKKAWAAHVSLENPGLYQLMTETRPRWDEERRIFEQQFIKTILPVYGLERGWDHPAGIKFEILPLTRPFGLLAPALFTGRVILSGAALANTPVLATRLNADKRGVPTEWHTAQVVKTNAAGEFSVICPLPGWWAVTATTAGESLKGPDGQPAPLELGAVLWVYVDDAKATSHKPQKNAK